MEIFIFICKFNHFSKWSVYFLHIFIWHLFFMIKERKTKGLPEMLQNVNISHGAQTNASWEGWLFQSLNVNIFPIFKFCLMWLIICTLSCSVMVKHDTTNAKAPCKKHDCSGPYLAPYMKRKNRSSQIKNAFKVFSLKNVTYL